MSVFHMGTSSPPRVPYQIVFVFRDIIWKAERSVSFSTPDATTLPALTEALRALEQTVITPDGRKAIKSFRGGKQVSIEGHDKGMKVVFLMEFEVCLPISHSSADSATP
jgi:hypothetical protein